VTRKDAQNPLDKRHPGRIQSSRAIPRSELRGRFTVFRPGRQSLITITTVQRHDEIRRQQLSVRAAASYNSGMLSSETPESPKLVQHRRRRLRFSLRSLFIAVTVFAAWLGWELKFIRARAAFAKDPAFGAMTTFGIGDTIDKGRVNGGIRITNELPWWRRLLGDQSYCVVFLEEGSEAAELDRVRRLFPEAEVMAAPSPFIHPIWQALTE